MVSGSQPPSSPSGWTENEDGPDCTCEGPTVVKFGKDGDVILLCLFHTPEAGTYFRLPEERPDNWPWTIDEVIIWNRGGLQSPQKK